jgi:hypothetical protein
MNGTKKFLDTRCLGMAATKAEVIGAAKAARGRQRHEKEADEARKHNAAALGDFRHVLLPDADGVRCEVCGARSKGAELSNRARLAKRVCPGSGALTEEDRKRRAFERDRKRAYLARRRALEETQQAKRRRGAAPPAAAAAAPVPDTPRPAAPAASRRRGRAAPAAPE